MSSDESGRGGLRMNAIKKPVALATGFLLVTAFSEPVASPDADRNGIGPKIVEHGLPFESCREIPVAGNLEVEASADIQTGSPPADIICRKAYGRVNLPLVAQMEDILGIEVQVYRAVIVEQKHHRRFDSPVVGDTVSGKTSQTDNAVSGIGVDVHARANRPFPRILSRCSRGHTQSRDCRKKNLFHGFRCFRERLIQKLYQTNIQ